MVVHRTSPPASLLLVCSATFVPSSRIAFGRASRGHCCFRALVAFFVRVLGLSRSPARFLLLCLLRWLFGAFSTPSYQAHVVSGRPRTPARLSGSGCSTRLRSNPCCHGSSTPPSMWWLSLKPEFLRAGWLRSQAHSSVGAGMLSWYRRPWAQVGGQLGASWSRVGLLGAFSWYPAR